MMKMAVGIPAFCELETLPATLHSLAAQDFGSFSVVVCINQPQGWFEDPAHEATTAENLNTLAWLEQERKHLPFPLEILNGIQPGLKPHGVGAARRWIFEHILNQDPEALCVSLDADTLLDTSYLGQLGQAFVQYPNGIALAAPYYHPLPKDPTQAVHLLRYEIYLRYYQLQLWRVGSPYSFLAIGSAFAFRGSSWVKSRGIPTRQAGEDFYFLQQLRKLGPIIRWLDSCAYPSARVSHRVPFGTGPLMGEPDFTLQEQRFPFYHPSGFDQLGQTFALLPEFHCKPCPLPIDPFLEARLGGRDSLIRMRQNFPDLNRFIRAFHDKFDGLRTLQFLRSYQEEKALDGSSANLMGLVPELCETGLEFDSTQLSLLDRIRNRLRDLEAENQRSFMNSWDLRTNW